MRRRAMIRTDDGEHACWSLHTEWGVAECTLDTALAGALVRPALRESSSMSVGGARSEGGWSSLTHHQ